MAVTWCNACRTLLVKFVGTCCGVCANISLGPEAPTVHIGACVANNVTHLACGGSLATKVVCMHPLAGTHLLMSQRSLRSCGLHTFQRLTACLSCLVKLLANNTLLLAETTRILQHKI